MNLCVRGSHKGSSKYPKDLEMQTYCTPAEHKVNRVALDQVRLPDRHRLCEVLPEVHNQKTCNIFIITGLMLEKKKK